MSTWTWIFVGIVVVLLLAMLMARRATGGMDPTQLLLDPDLVTRVRALARQGQQQAAITLLRDGTPGLGLAGAKVMVGRMATPRAGEPPRAGVPAAVEAQIRSLKASGDVDGAIELARTHLPDGRQARIYVDGV